MSLVDVNAILASAPNPFGEGLNPYYSFNTSFNTYINYQTPDYSKLFADYFSSSSSNKIDYSKYGMKDYSEEFKQKTSVSKYKYPASTSSVTKGSNSTVAMKDLDLKGQIAGCNSKPYIATRNSQNLKYLDDYLAQHGYDVIYTSAMGGHTKGGHVKGDKVDFQLYKNGKPAHLTQAELKELKDLGYYGNGTGAVGWEAHAEQNTGGHYDICIA